MRVNTLPVRNATDGPIRAGRHAVIGVHVEIVTRSAAVPVDHNTSVGPIARTSM